MASERTISERHGHGMRSSVLTDFEFRVWIQYQNSADDFGVMRMTPLQIQSDNAALAKRPQATIQKALESLVSVRLVQTFTHQGVAYLYQQDWQTFQKRTYVRKTTLPKPPLECLRCCDSLTQQLFRCYPGGVKTKGIVTPQGDEIPGTFQESSGNLPGSVSESSENIPKTFFPHAISTNIQVPKTIPSTGSPEPRSADFTFGTNGHARVLPADEAWEMFLAAYPGEARTAGFMENQAFLQACEQIPFATLMAKLERQKQCRAWQDGYIPKTKTYFTDKLWRQDVDEKPRREHDLALEHLRKIDERRKERSQS